MEWGWRVKKRVLVYPCGTEIGLEIYRAVNSSIHFELIGGSSTYDHGRFVYEKHIDNLPFIEDASTIEEIIIFNRMLEENKIDFIYPAMDGVLYKLGQYKDLLTPILIAPSAKTVATARSKAKTYELLKDCIEVPKRYDTIDQIEQYPVFIKPDVGQGSKNAMMISNPHQLRYEMEKVGCAEMLILEYLPGEEYTIDCFTNEEGRLIYAGGRTRKRIKNGISVNAIEYQDSEFFRIAAMINSVVKQKGGWFFQLKKNSKGRYSLLEIAARIAGTSSFTRNMGVNLPLLTLHLFNGSKIDSVIKNDYHLELDRALYNKFQSDLRYDRVYVDYDDTLVTEGRVNTQLLAFLFQCRNESIPVILLSKHQGNLVDELKKMRVYQIFDNVLHLEGTEEKYQYISGDQPIFIDDSYGERERVHQMLKIPVFDVHMIECLLHHIG